MKARVPNHELRRPKQISPSPLGKDQNKSHQNLSRSFPLLLLIIYAATTTIRLASSPSTSSPLRPSVLPLITETKGKDLDNSKTHITTEPRPLQAHEEKLNSPTICQALIDVGRRDDTGVLCCDRSHNRTDVCYMKGDIRTEPKSSSILLYNISGQPERIQPYTRKWETSVMATIDELTLVPIGKLGPILNETGACDVRHNVPAVVLSTGGYTGNVYHEFNDGLIPLYLTAERFNREVVFVVLEYHSWWRTKYSAVVEKLSNHKLVDFRRDQRVHCFPEMIVGMRIHGELSIDPQLMPTGKTIQDFQSLLFQSFVSRKATAQPLRPHPSLPPGPGKSGRPKITIFIRTSSRVILNLRPVLRRCRRLGFQPQILNPRRGTSLSLIHDALSTSDVMLAVHGAAMTHLLFVRPGSALIQVVPLGLDWAADEYYGQPARKLGLEYMEYKVLPGESSLSKEYDREDPVIADPSAVTSKGWQETKRIYLEHQNVTLDVGRFGKVLAKAYSHVRGSHKGGRR